MIARRFEMQRFPVGFRLCEAARASRSGLEGHSGPSADRSTIARSLVGGPGLRPVAAACLI
jgi:hypothetical protein